MEPIKFQSVKDLLDLAGSPIPNVPDESRSSITNSEKFTGTKSLQEAITLARTGWRDGTQRIKWFHAIVDRNLQGQIPVPEVFYDVVGDVYDMGRVVSGEPESAMTIVDSSILRPSHAAKVIRIVMNISVGGAVSEETVLLRGAAVCVLIDVLERRGVRCEVTLAYASQARLNDGPRLEVYAPIKQASEYVSFDKLAFFLGHRSSLRRIMFSVLEHQEEAERRSVGAGRFMGGYGFPGTVTDTGDIYIDRILTTTDWSESFTLAWLRLQLQRQGITLLDTIQMEAHS